MNKNLSSFSLLGCNISVLSSYRETYDTICSRKNESGYVTVNNVHTVTESVRNSSMREAINNSFLSLPDGRPISLYANMKKHKEVRRIFGPTFLEKTLEWGEAEGIKHYFFGSSEDTLLRMVGNVRLKFPNANIVGMKSPPYREFSELENELFLSEMNESNADIFWIGLGAPKQELWMYENYKKLNRGVMIGVGAGFDYLAGNIKHAPHWMKNYSLEWFYRLIQDPRRLWKRYLVTNSLFLYYIFLEFTGLRKFR